LVRFFELNIDVPEVIKDPNTKLLKYLPNQKGFSENGDLWKINQFGYPGHTPKNFNNLISVVGDSYIAGFMNPFDCHQSRLLAERNKQFDFFPIARAGAGVLEFVESIKAYDSLNFVAHFVFLSEGDFLESIKEIKKLNSCVQVSLETGSLKYPALSNSTLKTIFRKFQFGYFIYRKYILSKNKENREIVFDNKLDYNRLNEFVKFLLVNYSLDNVVFVFKPFSDEKLIEICKSNGIEVLELVADDYSSWSFEFDKHWSCVGHKYAAEQVTKYLQENLSENK